MTLTPHARSHPSPDGFPTAQLFLLAICRVAEPIALTSIFPYSWVMVKDFHLDNGNNASLYAGILISAFSLAEALTGMFWGALSDRLGRKPILISGCVGTMASLLLVGMAPNFWVALAGRALGGALNGNIGVIQTMVGELVKRPEHEPRAYAIMPFVWSIGTIIGPAIGGLLAKPAEGFPSLFPADGFFGKFPYLLPNLVCCVLLLLSIVGSWVFLQESHPNMQSGEIHGYFDQAAEQPLLVTSGATANAGVDLQAESYGTFNRVQLHNDKNWNVQADDSSSTWKKLPKPKTFTWRVTMLVVALAIFTYHSMTYDHLLPIFLQDKDPRGLPHSHHSPFDIPGGVGLSTRAVGVIMSTDGIIALVIQSIIFPVLTHYLGIWHLFIIVTVLHPIAYLMVPFLVFLPAQLIYVGIYTCLLVRNILSIIDYPILLILIKKASPSDSVMGKINGLAASAGAASRTLAPPIAGFLYSLGAEIGCTGVAWWGSSLVALVGALQLWYIQRDKRSSAIVEPTAVCHYIALPDQPHEEIVHIMVDGDDALTETVIVSD
ncbi:Tetracycline resistance protein TetA/multidrug resistance protein MdtG [Penicillium fimorum]|uniref:Tetracycline resistance protein TetA/multidrug resistance protein MdtG n=1 Tax=Penicillium fimorum TaxID=1882269 RepID=A0A9W9XNS3_9EURO|nr:Tetracycline resistance protein TetA/multidrug resistance protein MdtG [Penicillium fimorum]